MKSAFPIKWGAVIRSHHRSWRTRGFEQTDEHPVEKVSWNEAVEFCEWSSEKEEFASRHAARIARHLSDISIWVTALLAMSNSRQSPRLLTSGFQDGHNGFGAVPTEGWEK